MRIDDLIRHRQWHVVHGKDGFALMVRDEFVPYLVAERVMGYALAAVGHPCCDRGLWQYVPGAQYVGYRLLNLPNRLYRHGRQVISIPLTVEQALTLHPRWKDSWMLEDGTDEFGYTWKDAVMIGTPEDEETP